MRQHLQKTTWTFMGEIPSQKNKVRYAHGHAYYANDEINNFRDAFNLQCPSHLKIDYPGTTKVTLKYWLKDWRKDTHNLEAAIYDGLQSICVIKNDRKIIEGHWRLMGIDPLSPRVEITIEPVKDIKP